MSSPMQSRQSLPFPPSTILLDGYASNATTFAGRSPRSSETIINDPIATHLLVETALGDSKQFEVLSPEELESLKKEDAMLISRIDSVRRKLVLENKVRDAATSLNRLYTSHKRKSSGMSMPSPPMGRKNSAAPKRETMERSEAELAESNQKCEQLSRELYYLEQRSRQTQMRLLQHTAAILQITYGNGHRPNPREMELPGARPYSPESLRDFDRGWDGTDSDKSDKILAQGAESLDGFLDELRGGGNSKTNAKRREAQQSIGRRLEELNAFVREIIGQVNPQNELASNPPPKSKLDTPNIDGAIFDQLNSLNQGLDELKSEQRNIQVAREIRSGPSTPGFHNQTLQLRSELESSIKENLALQKEYDDAEDNMTRMLEELNNRLFDVISISSPADATAVPSIPGIEEGPAQQITYARARLGAITKIIQSLTVAAQRSRSASASNGDRSSQYEVVLNGLWQIILAGEDDSRQRKRQEREQLEARRASGEGVDSDDDLSPDEEDGLSETFSLPAFSTKVQWLVSKSTYLKEKQSNLRRRMRQLRVVATNSQAAAANSAETESLREQLDRTNDLYLTAKDELSAAESRAAALEADLAKTSSSSQAALTDAQSRSAKAENELRELEGEVVRLTTDLTIARADLDAAYGSRQERAAEVAKAAESEATQKLEMATQRETTLRAELASTLSEFEELTRASVEAEKEREEMEKTADQLREVIEGLEGQLSDERVGRLGMGAKSPMPPGVVDGQPVVQSTSAGMLKTEFKKMMRDTRMEHQKALRAEQEERRKLEALVRTLRREAAAGPPGKSNLSYSTKA